MMFLPSFKSTKVIDIRKLDKMNFSNMGILKAVLISTDYLLPE